MKYEGSGYFRILLPIMIITQPTNEVYFLLYCFIPQSKLFNDKRKSHLTTKNKLLASYFV